jgi:hypothetical protein
VFFLERLYFLFQFSFVLFDAINGWTPAGFFWRRHTSFSLPRTLYFSSTAFSFYFSPSFLFGTCLFFVARCV